MSGMSSSGSSAAFVWPTPMTDLAMGTHRFTGVGDATALTNFASASQVRLNSLNYMGSTGGTANAITVTNAAINPALSSLTTGQVFWFIPGSTNTAAATLKVGADTAASITYCGNLLVGGEIAGGVPCACIFNGGVIELLNHGGGWATYTPTLGAVSPMTFTSTSVVRARYQRHGATVILQVVVSGTTGGTAAKNISITLPVTAASTALGFTARIFGETGADGCAGASNIANTTTVYVTKYDASNFGLGAGREITLVGTYEAT